MLKVAFAALAACVITPALSAAPVANPLAKSSSVLKLDGLDLATPQGQRALAVRMDQAARDVCGTGLATVHLAAGAQSRTCQSDVKADIRAQIEQRATVASRVSPAPVVLAAR